MGTARSDYYAEADCEVMARVKGLMPETELSFSEWAQRIGLPDRVSFYDHLHQKLRLADLANTGEILNCSADELLYGELRRRPGTVVTDSDPRGNMVKAPTRWTTVTLQGSAKFRLSAYIDDFLFYRGVRMQVPEAIANELAVLTGPEGEPLFDIEDCDDSDDNGADEDADICEALGIQLKFRTFSR